LIQKVVAAGRDGGGEGDWSTAALWEIELVDQPMLIKRCLKE